MSMQDPFTFLLPAGLGHARDLTLAGQFTEADTAELEFADVGTRTAARLATSVVPDGELVGAGSLDYQTEFCHFSFYPLISPRKELPSFSTTHGQLRRSSRW